MLIVAIRKKSFLLNQSELYETFAPYVRLELIILYFYAVFHKLNFDFFNPVISCGSYFYQTQSTRFTFLPDSQFLEIFCMIATLFFEICIPLLLISSTRRNLGVLVALVFHGIIGFNPTSEFWNFSALVYAILILFTPIDFSKKCMDLFSDFQKFIRIFSHKIHLHISFKKYGKSIAWTLFLLGVGVLVLIDDKLFEVRSGLVLWTIYMVVIIALFIMNIGWRRIIKEDLAHREVMFYFKSYLLFLMPLVTFLNGTSPYLGLKTESSFAMFSNLRTEGGISNHFLIPNSWQVFDFQKDLVEIVDSSDDYLSSLAKEELLLPYFEFKKYLQTHPQVSVTYIRRGESFTLKTIQDNPEFLQKDPWYLRSFLVFRPVSKKTPTPCTR